MSNALQELRAKRAEADKAAAEAESAATEKQLIADETKVAELRRSGMRVVDLGKRVALVGKPSPAEFERFIDSKLTMQDHLQLLRSCLVYPAVDEVYDQYPGRVAQLSSAAVELAGVERKETAAKH